MRILVVDDNVEKIKDISLIVSKSIENKRYNLEYVNTTMDARIKLVNSEYDLMILDLNLPRVIEEKPSTEEGDNLLFDVMNDVTINVPSEVIVLTAFENLFASESGNSNEYGFLRLKYDIQSTSWESKLSKRLKFLDKVFDKTHIISKKFDVLIITAVNIEAHNIHSSFSGWETIDFLDAIDAEECTIKDSRDLNRSICHIQLNEMGLTSAAAISSLAINLFDPKYIIMSGIAGGIKDKTNYGDIILPKSVNNYSVGKYEKINEDVKLSPYSPNISVSNAVERMINKNYRTVLAKIVEEYQGEIDIKSIKIHNGPMASGSAVVSESKIIEEQIMAHNVKIRGIDMEAYSVLFSAKYSRSAVQGIIIKSVSDFADNEKNDIYQDFAAFTSSRFVKYLIENSCLDL